MSKPSDIIRIEAVRLYFLPVQSRVPIKFGSEVLTAVTCARVGLKVVGANGRAAEGWGETPLSVQWVWPSPLPYEERHAAVREFCVRLARTWESFRVRGHPIEAGHEFQHYSLPDLLEEFNAERVGREPMPWLAALVCCSAFDLALHDAYGCLLERPTYSTYNAEFLNRDLGFYLEPAYKVDINFGGKYPDEFLLPNPPKRLRAWHLVGGLDPIDASELTGQEPKDAYPVLLADWIRADGLKCLKIKLRGTDLDWDYARLIKVGDVAGAHGVDWLTADFNCTVKEPGYVNEILDRLRDEHPRHFAMILYIEQPFAYDLEHNQIDVHNVAARKPLFLDESAHDWQRVRLGRDLGWTGVALKTCKTQTGALLAACWAKAHGMALMVQDLSNPMLAQIPHVLLAAHVGTIMGVETNGMQYYPEASAPEAAVHTDLYRRREGTVNWSSVHGSGFGYRIDEIKRELPTRVPLGAPSPR